MLLGQSVLYSSAAKTFGSLSVWFPNRVPRLIPSYTTNFIGSRTMLLVAEPFPLIWVSLSKKVVDNLGRITLLQLDSVLESFGSFGISDEPFRCFMATQITTGTRNPTRGMRTAADPLSGERGAKSAFHHGEMGKFYGTIHGMDDKIILYLRLRNSFNLGLPKSHIKPSVVLFLSRDSNQPQGVVCWHVYKIEVLTTHRLLPVLCQSARCVCVLGHCFCVWTPGVVLSWR